MPTTLTEEAVEQSTYGIRMSFYDDSDPPELVAPNSGLTWTLTDLEGNVVNSRDAVPISSATSITIVLHGDDLGLSSAYRDNWRMVTVEGTYNSSLGSGLELVDWVLFEITANPIV